MTEKLKEIVAFSENKGPYGILAAIVASIVALAQLSPDQIQRIREFWPLLQSPAGLLLLSTPILWSFKIIFLDKVGGYLIQWVDAYLQEQAARTVVESKIHGKLEDIANQLKEMLSHHWDDRRYFDEELDHFRARFDAVDKSTQAIFRVLEKRKDITYPSGDTEKFLAEAHKAA
jgi:hypothetical protein